MTGPLIWTQSLLQIKQMKAKDIFTFSSIKHHKCKSFFFTRCVFYCLFKLIFGWKYENMIVSWLLCFSMKLFIRMGLPWTRLCWAFLLASCLDPRKVTWPLTTLATRPRECTLRKVSIMLHKKLGNISCPSVSIYESHYIHDSVDWNAPWMSSQF